MALILRGIDSIAQHNIHVFTSPDEKVNGAAREAPLGDYRPSCCPYCGKEKPWHFGHYNRQSDREHGGRNSLNPVRILRFLLSFLQTNLFNAARMPCSEAVVSMAYPTGSSGHALTRNACGSN